MEDHEPTARERNMIENVRWIIGTDTPERVALRVGYSTVDHLTRTLNKCGQHEMASRLMRAHNAYMAVVSA